MTNREKNEHNAVVTDGELDHNEHPIGKLVHLSTVTHAFRGYLLAVTPSYYILDENRPWALVDSTGAMADYTKNMSRASDGDHVKAGSGVCPRILRGAVSWMLVKD